MAGIGADTFSVRWSGAIIPRYSQTYTFSTTSDDGVRLWVNGTRVIDAWTTHSSRVDSGTITLTAGVPVPIVLEYFEATGSAVAQLRWSSSSQAAELVPTDRLRPYYAVNMQPAGTPVPAGYAPDTGAVYAKRASGLSYGWNADNSSAMRDRNSSLSADQRYDTLAFLQLAPEHERPLGAGGARRDVQRAAGRRRPDRDRLDHPAGRRERAGGQRDDDHGAALAGRDRRRSPSATVG